MVVAIEVLFPNAISLVDYMVRDDGNGPYIAQWNPSLGPQPTVAQLAAVTQQQVDDAKAAKAKQEAVAKIDSLDPSINAMFESLRKEIESLKLQLANQVDGKPVEKVPPKTIDEIKDDAKSELTK